jgi:hypothetical protein
MDPDPGGPKSYGSDGSGFGSGSATLVAAMEENSRIISILVSNSL